jgi:hypothetical protein
LVQSFLNELGFVILNTPAKTAFPKQWFTDSVYHADGGCRRIRTEDLVQKLRPYYGLPSISDDIGGIFLVGGGVNCPRAGNTFANRPDVRVKYLSQERVNHPDALTPGDLPALLSRGIPIWFDDPKIEPLLSQGDWDLKEVDRDRESLDGWFKKYDHHLFVMGSAGPLASPIGADCPAEVQATFKGPGLAVAIVGTGPWRPVERLVVHAKSVLIRTDLSSLVGNNVPNLSITAGCSTGAGSSWSRIRLDNRLYVEGGPGEISVAVIDPENGVMVDSTTFKGGEERTLWSLRRLVPHSVAILSAAHPARAD